MNRFPTLVRSAALALLLSGLSLLAIAPAAHGEQVTVAYTVSGPDANGHCTYTLKVTNNTGGRTVTQFEQNRGMNQTGTGTAGDPPNWSHIFTCGTNDTASVVFLLELPQFGGVPEMIVRWSCEHVTPTAGAAQAAALAPSMFPAGEHRVQVIGGLAHEVAAGVHLLRIEGPGLSGSRRVILLK